MKILVTGGCGYIGTELIKTLLKNKGDMQIWFSDNEKRIPVQVEIKLKFGTMLMKLKKVSFLEGGKNH